MKKPHSFLNEKALQEANNLCNEFSLTLEDNIRSHSKNRIIILTDEPRAHFFIKLENIGWERDIVMPGSSQGGYKKDNIELIVKSKQQTLLGGAGIENETIFYTYVSKSISESPFKYVNLNINSTVGLNLQYEYVTDISHIGREGHNLGWKGDVRLTSPEYTEHISIKKDGGYRWESAMTRYKDLYEKLMEKAHNNEIPDLELIVDKDNPKVLQMMNTLNNKPYSKIYISNVPDLMDNLHSLAFGNDNAKVVQRTFTHSDFYFCTASNALNVTSTKNISNISEIEYKDLPVMELERNASKATKINGWKGRGIVLRISPQEALLKKGDKANILIVDYSNIYNNMLI
jgi:hypothetical protein